MSHILEDFRHFLENSPSAWHAVQEVGNRLAAVDFIPLDEKEKWHLEKGEKYFVHRGGFLAAFILPKEKPLKMQIVASHTDSPALKLKPHPEIHEENLHLLETEIYGSPLLHSWFNRDLAIAGRILIQNKKNEIEEKLVFLDEAPIFIPQIALHLDREINEKGAVIDKQNQLRAVLNLNVESKNGLEELLRKHISFDTLLSFDLFLVPLEHPRFLGSEEEMLGSYRLDNLASVHACAHAIASSTSSPSLQMALFWDHEEVGSRTTEGASSPLLSDLFKRILPAVGLSEEEIICLKNSSLCASVDVAHAFNPNFPSKFDPNHKSLMGKGIVLKYNADKKYASDGKTAATILHLGKKLKLNIQSFTSHSNVSCGSTIGPIIAQTMGIPTVDIGCPIFSMHSAREVIGCQDHVEMCQFLTELLNL